MKCPDCGKPLKHIARGEEWCCTNDKCPSNDGPEPGYAEYYGTTQKQINKLGKVRKP